MARHVFISHDEADVGICRSIAGALEQAGFATWYYERDSLPGPAYLTQVGKAIEQASVVIVIASSQSLNSQQVTNEVVRAYEHGKPFLPVLRSLTHAELQQRQPVWRQALGAATSVEVSNGQIMAVVPRIVAGVEALVGGASAAHPEGDARGEAADNKPPSIDRGRAVTGSISLPRWFGTRGCAATVAISVLGLLVVVASYRVVATHIGRKLRVAAESLSVETGSPAGSSDGTAYPEHETPLPLVPDAREQRLRQANVVLSTTQAKRVRTYLKSDSGYIALAKMTLFVLEGLRLRDSVALDDVYSSYTSMMGSAAPSAFSQPETLKRAIFWAWRKQQSGAVTESVFGQIVTQRK